MKPVWHGLFTLNLRIVEYITRTQQVRLFTSSYNFLRLCLSLRKSLVLDRNTGKWLLVLCQKHRVFQGLTKSHRDWSGLMTTRNMKFYSRSQSSFFNHTKREDTTLCTFFFYIIKLIQFIFYEKCYFIIRLVENKEK